jgi:hypothetical protein
VPLPRRVYESRARGADPWSLGVRPQAVNMKLYVEPMDTVVVEVSQDGRVRYESGEWAAPSLQERRAIIYAATNEIEEIRDGVADPGSLGVGPQAVIEELQEAIQLLQDGKIAGWKD